MGNEKQIKALLWLDNRGRATYSEFAFEFGDSIVEDLSLGGLVVDASTPNARTASYVVSRKGHIALSRYLQDKEAECLRETPHVPAQVDVFLSGDVARLNATALHDAGTIDQAQDVAQVKDSEIDKLVTEFSGQPAQRVIFELLMNRLEDRQRIAELEVENERIAVNLRSAEKGIRDHNTVITQMGEKARETEALLQEAREAMVPIHEAVALDTDLMKSKDGAGLYIRNSDGDRFIPIETQVDELHVRHLRAIAAVAAKIDAALK